MLLPRKIATAFISVINAKGSFMERLGFAVVLFSMSMSLLYGYECQAYRAGQLKDISKNILGESGSAGTDEKALGGKSVRKDGR